MIGYAKLKDREAFTKWLKEEGIHKSKNPKYNTKEAGWYNSHWTEYGYTHQKKLNEYKPINIFETGRTNEAEFFELLDHLEETHQKLCLFYHDDFACIVGYGAHKYVMPSNWFEFEELQDPLSLPSPTSLFPIANKDIKKKEEELAKETDDLSELEKSIKEGTEESLTELQSKINQLKQEMEEKQKVLMAELQKKKDELAVKMNELNKELFLLETQIYGIRCYLGEVVSFYQLRKGTDAEIKEPIVLYQKIRYLDEELGKCMAVYSEDYKEEFLSLISRDDSLFELFTPSVKCMSVIKPAAKTTGLAPLVSGKVLTKT